MGTAICTSVLERRKVHAVGAVVVHRQDGREYTRNVPDYVPDPRRRLDVPGSRGAAHVLLQFVHRSATSCCPVACPASMLGVR